LLIGEEAIEVGLLVGGGFQKNNDIIHGHSSTGGAAIELGLRELVKISGDDARFARIDGLVNAVRRSGGRGDGETHYYRGKNSHSWIITRFRRLKSIAPCVRCAIDWARAVRGLVARQAAGKVNPVDSGRGPLLGIH
jgi:hypothetical protein